ncbi:MAG TPA: prenyltransferase/squalene oxidase repeat-containing protein, partial [Tepidisphaeraceae bacterium]|nr:prenyltransferase/squalene oxidase repeat-containing protein [Tepidisphaeraceae bacterium]
LRLPVVSYALPALIAIGLVRHRHRPTRNPAARAARRLACRRAVQLLEQIQPASGGFLEATPLTSFVVMSLIGAGLSDHSVVRNGIEFLVRSARPDGSWPIDTNLATWATTLAVNALATDPDFHQFLPENERLRLRTWLLNQQYRTEHPYTLADPGGWAWTDLSGGVPDADDTPGALLALKHLAPADEQTSNAARAGIKWLCKLQNRDGGIPTFCRGWGKLPFDRSSPDLTAHALRAWAAWDSSDLTSRARHSAIEYLIRTQRPDGAWVPLWFGNQYVFDDQNPTYGTARVLRAAFHDYGLPWSQALWRGAQWLLRAQNPDGGWGGDVAAPSSIEETALAIEALTGLASDAAPGGTGVSPVRTALEFEHPQHGRDTHASGQFRSAAERGVNWLIARTGRGTSFDPSPIGFYFARLWYYEKLYPVIFTVAALNKWVKSCRLWQERRE